MSINAKESSANKKFEPLDDFVERISKEISGPESPDPALGEIVARHLLPRNKRPDAIDVARKEFAELIKNGQGA